MSDFRLDKASHTYHLDERIVPGCTSVLKYWHIIDPTVYPERNRQVGTAVHAWSILVDRGTLDWNRVEGAPEVAGRLRGYAQFLTDYKPQWEYTEESFYYAGGLYACTIDRAGVITFGAPGGRQVSSFVIVELKCGGREWWHTLQTGMQQKAMDSRPWRRFALYLKEDGTYALEEHPDPQAGMVGIGLASAMNYRLNHGG